MSEVEKKVAEYIFKIKSASKIEEIDTLRAKFEKENQQEKLVILDEINAYVEELEKTYLKV